MSKEQHLNIFDLSDAVREVMAALPPTPWEVVELHPDDFWVSSPDGRGGCDWVLQHLDKEEAERWTLLGNAIGILIKQRGLPKRPHWPTEPYRDSPRPVHTRETDIATKDPKRQTNA